MINAFLFLFLIAQTEVGSNFSISGEVVFYENCGGAEFWGKHFDIGHPGR